MLIHITPITRNKMVRVDHRIKGALGLFPQNILYATVQNAIRTRETNSG